MWWIDSVDGAAVFINRCGSELLALKDDRPLLVLQERQSMTRCSLVSQLCWILTLELAVMISVKNMYTCETTLAAVAGVEHQWDRWSPQLLWGQFLRGWRSNPTTKTSSSLCRHVKCCDKSHGRTKQLNKHFITAVSFPLTVLIWWVKITK